MQNKLTPKKLDSYRYSIGGNDFNKYITSSTYEVVSKYYYGKTCLELGCADGYGTSFLLKKFERVVAVDGSKRMLDNLGKKIKSKKLEAVHSMFENLKINEKFDTVVITHVLDIVDSPIQILKIAKKFAHKKTKIILVVSNSNSLHRQIGVHLGLLKREQEFNKADKTIGHQRIYNMELLLEHIKDANLKVLSKGGFLLKPFSNAQMYKLIGNKPKTVNAYVKLGEKYPDVAAEIYAVCSA